MKPKAYSLLLVTAVAVLFLAAWTGYAQKDASAPNGRIVWEYKTIRGERALTEATLNDMGSYGWELVIFDDGERGNGSYAGTYHFKRVK